MVIGLLLLYSEAIVESKSYEERTRLYHDESRPKIVIVELQFSDCRNLEKVI